MEQKDFFELIQKQGMVAPEEVPSLKRAVDRIVRRLARGETVKLPGVGKLIPQVRKSILFQSGGRQRKEARGGGR